MSQKLAIKPQNCYPHICHVVASINEEVGGPAYSVTHLTQALSKQQIFPHLFTLNYQKVGHQLATNGVTLHSYNATPVARYLRGFQPSAYQHLEQLASAEIDLIHNHGLWMFPNIYARQAAVINRLPLVISPRGMLESWSLKHSWYKKRLAWILYERKNLKSATAFHATSDEEVQSIRRLGYKQPIALIPNGITIPSLSNLPKREVLIQAFPKLNNKKWLLFLSRLHPKKGIDNLLYVWQSLVNQFPNWHLIIAGPDLIYYQAKLESLTTQLQLTEKVTFTGMLSGELKVAALSQSNLFVLPTHSENFGIAIAESLAYGIPAITTKGAPWKDLVEYHCGWWIDDNQKALKEALLEAINLSDKERQEMGDKGRIMVEKKYSWGVIAEEMSKVYHWILGEDNYPSSIHLY
ncbi:glycosyl transferases group 1 family protein [Lyngbya aestuarii BL J]|uniref:Glycosyl transferases group 1 family protein n=1 Tax=Lyngbya aestuarii BL J TaxID=1348334 RepID=U7QLN1_9CYAN|nr:glycosyltransferase [Lyngbya aestuarii]ERT08182.1 glycosyl transferases group 1 family protein [Lyngbya aestuarii BL J]